MLTTLNFSKVKKNNNIFPNNNNIFLNIYPYNNIFPNNSNIFPNKNIFHDIFPNNNYIFLNIFPNNNIFLNIFPNNNIFPQPTLTICWCTNCHSSFSLYSILVWDTTSALLMDIIRDMSESGSMLEVPLLGASWLLFLPPWVLWTDCCCWLLARLVEAGVGMTTEEELFPTKLKHFQIQIFYFLANNFLANRGMKPCWSLQETF